MLPPRAYYFFGLNAVRVLSIVSLLLVFASSIFALVNDIKAVNNFVAATQAGNSTADAMLDCDYIEGSTVPNQPAGVFWAVVSRLLLIFEVIVLLFSELGWPSTFFDRFFPVLGPSFGLGALGIFQCLIGATILSHHVDDFSLVSAFFLFALGCLNMFLGLIFREKAKSKRSITSWRAEAKGILPTTSDNRPVFTNVSPSFVPNVFSGEKAPMSFRTSEFGVTGRDSASRPGYGFGRQGEKAAGLKGFLISKPVESLPRYAMRPASSTGSDRSSFASPESPRPTHSRSVTPTFKSSSTAI